MATKTIPKLSYEFHASAIISAYFLGFFIAYMGHALTCIASRSFTHYPLFPFLMIGGAILALPLLGIILALLPFSAASMERHTLRWCMWTPIVISGICLIVEYLSIAPINVFDANGYFLNKNALEFALLALLCSGISSAIYYFQVKRQLKNLADADDAAATLTDHG
jgi:hypothetical protein